RQTSQGRRRLIAHLFGFIEKRAVQVDGDELDAIFLPPPRHLIALSDGADEGLHLFGLMCVSLLGLWLSLLIDAHVCSRSLENYVTGCYRASPMDTQDAAAMPAPALPTSYRKLPRMQELGLLIVILILGLVLSLYGFYDAKRIGGTNTFLNLNNLIGQIATYM